MLCLASGSINHLAGAKAYLISRGYLIQGGEVSFLGLLLILFQTAAEVKLPALADSIKAAAFLLEALGVDSISEQIAGSVEAKLTGLFDSFKTSIAGLEAKDKELGDSVQAISNAADSLRHLNKQIIDVALPTLRPPPSPTLQ